MTKVHVTIEFFKDLVEKVRVFADEADADAEREQVGDYDGITGTGVRQFEADLEG